jgi:hypothetical protein
MPKPKSQPRTLADFKAAHDPDVIIPAKMRAALAAIEKEGAENWLYEEDFRKLASISATQLGAFRDQFAAHIVETPGMHGKSGKRVYFGNAKVAAKLRT